MAFTYPDKHICIVTKQDRILNKFTSEATKKALNLLKELEVEIKTNFFFEFEKQNQKSRDAKTQ